MNKIFYNPLILLLMIFTLFCGYKIRGICRDYYLSSRSFEDITEFITQVPAAMPPADTVMPVTDIAEGDYEVIVDVVMPQLKVPVNLFLTELQQEINPDIIAWINIPGTNIDYPIAQGGDNDFYLRRNIYKEESSSGCIFMDFRCDAELAHYNTVIYGHNMRNRSMFASLSLFADPGFFDENRSGTLHTVYGTYTLNIFAYLVTDSDDAEIYSNLPASDTYFDYIKENARNYREPVNPERIVTLSTCAYEFDGARTVVLAYISS